MAPIRPKAKPGKGLTKETPLTNNDDGFDAEFRTSKKDKRVIKRSTFMNKIEKSRTKPLKRRRPSKKLKTNLDSLADALPDADDDMESGAAGNSQVNIIKHKSLKHKPGAMKRKEKLDKMERDRFARNMNQLAAGLDAPVSGAVGGDADMGDAGTGSEAGDAGRSSRWAALRGFISQTMEHNPGFKDVGSS